MRSLDLFCNHVAAFLSESTGGFDQVVQLGDWTYECANGKASVKFKGSLDDLIAPEAVQGFTTFRLAVVDNYRSGLVTLGVAKLCESLGTRLSEVVPVDQKRMEHLYANLPPSLGHLKVKLK